MSHLSSTQSGNESNFAVFVRFFHQLVLRKSVVIASLALTLSLGFFYLLTATRIYKAKGQVLVLQPSHPSAQTGMEKRVRMEEVMGTIQKLLQSNVVLNGALERLSPQERVSVLMRYQTRRYDGIRGDMGISLERNTNLLDITYRHPDKKICVSMINALLASYFDFMDQTQRDNSRKLLDLLQEEKEVLEKELSEKEKSVLQLRSQIGDLFGTGRATKNIRLERIVSLTETLIEMQNKSMEARSFYMGVNQAINTGANLQEFLMKTSSKLGWEFVRHEMGLDEENVRVLERIQHRFLDDKASLQEQLKHKGQNHPDVLKISSRIKASEKWIRDFQQNNILQAQQTRDSELGPRLLEIAKQKLALALTQEQAVYEQYEYEREKATALNNKLATLEILNLDLRRLRAIYDSLLNRIQELDLSMENGLKVRVVSEPQLPEGASSPRTKIVGLFCIASGLGLGCFIVYLLDLLDDRFRSPEELRQQLNIPVLAMVRQLEEYPGTGMETISSYANPNGVGSEPFRSLRSSLLFHPDGVRRIMVTSSEPSDGKTTVMGNLAVTFAQSGHKTLLIDADMRRPGLSTLLDIRGTKGLSTILRDDRPVEMSIQDNLQNTLLPGLDVIASGPRPSNPAELLSQRRFAEILAWADGQYNYILIDTPPVMAVTDPLIVGRLVDGMLMVIQPAKNQRKTVIRSVETIQSNDLNLLGLIANKLSTDQNDGYYGYTYEYEYGHTSEEDAADGNPLPSAA